MNLRVGQRRRALAAISIAVITAAAATVLFTAPRADAKADANPGPRDVIVHLFQWPWASIASECTNVLGPKGFGAVQVSPPQEHVRAARRTATRGGRTTSRSATSSSAGAATGPRSPRWCRPATPPA